MAEPSAAGATQRRRCSAVPWAAIVAAAVATEATTGTGASVRPTCSTTRHCSTRP
jgi:hypothetical protein